MNANRLTKAEKAERKAVCLENLRSELAPGQTVYVTTTSVGRSGMTRYLRFLLVTVPRFDDRPQAGELVNTRSHLPQSEQGGPSSALRWSYGPTNVGRLRDATWWAAHAAGLPYVEDKGIKMGGCGYNTHHKAVDSLAHALDMPLRYESL